MRGGGKPRNLFNDEIFPIYGITNEVSTSQSVTGVHTLPHKIAMQHILDMHDKFITNEVSTSRSVIKPTTQWHLRITKIQQYIPPSHCSSCCSPRSSGNTAKSGNRGNKGNTGNTTNSGNRGNRRGRSVCSHYSLCFERGRNTE